MALYAKIDKVTNFGCVILSLLSQLITATVPCFLSETFCIFLNKVIGESQKQFQYHEQFIANKNTLISTFGGFILHKS